VVLGNVVGPMLGVESIQFVQSHPALGFLAQVGVLILLFGVGLESDLRALARVGPSAALVAILGVAAPVGLGWATAAWLVPEAPLLAHVFVGATLAATSVGITMRVLKDLGVMQGPSGQVILGAAILDDILGLVLLAVLAGATAGRGGEAMSATAVVAILVKAALFLGFAIVAGHYGSERIVGLAGRARQSDVVLVLGVALCFTMAFVSEQLGLADIIGAFAAGLILDPYGKGVSHGGTETSLEEMLHPLQALFVPLFFVLVGLQVRLGTLTDPGALGFGLALTVAALAGKLVCAGGVLAPGASRLVVALGMVPRGEVGIVFAGIGTRLSVNGEPLLSQSTFSGIILMVLLTTLAGPIALRWAVARERAAAGTPAATPQKPSGPPPTA
jgi:Kef-type K+ transport system membrane component KefB